MIAAEEGHAEVCDYLKSLAKIAMQSVVAKKVLIHISFFHKLIVIAQQWSLTAANQSVIRNPVFFGVDIIYKMLISVYTYIASYCCCARRFV